MNEDTKLEEKIIDLESRLAFAEVAVSEMNSALAGQDREIQSLRNFCRELQKKITDLAEAGSSNLNPNQKPPHY